MGKTLISYYTRVSQLFEAGYSKVLWRVNSVVQILLILNTFLILKGYDFGILEYILMAGGLIIVIFSVGYIYLKFGFFKADQRAIYSQNEIITNIEKEVQEIKKMLKERGD